MTIVGQIQQNIFSYINSFLNIITSEAFWVAAGAVATSATLIYFIRKDDREQRRSIVNIKQGLYVEMLTNIKLLFSGEVERRPLFDVIGSIRKDYIKYVSDQELLFKIQSLYVELDYYQIFVQKVYLNKDIHQSGKAVTEKQLSTMNKFIQFFNQQPITPNDNESIDLARNRAINLKNDSISNWEIKLKEDIDKLFK